MSDSKDDNSVRLLAITGASYCGSTYFAYVVGSHPEVLNVGESRSFPMFGDQCTLCARKGVPCPIFTEALKNVPKGTWFRALSERAGVSTIVSTDKAAFRYDGTTEGCVVLPILYFRNPLAHVASFKMHHMLAAEGVPESKLLWMDKQCSSISKIIAFMSQQYTEAMAFTASTPDSLFIDHDYLSAYRQPVFTYAFDRLGLTFNAAYLNYRNYEHHPVSGNLGVHGTVARDPSVPLLERMFPDVLPHREWPSWNLQPRDVIADQRWKHFLDRDEVTQVLESALAREIYPELVAKFMGSLRAWLTKQEIQDL